MCDRAFVNMIPLNVVDLRRVRLKKCNLVPSGAQFRRLRHVNWQQTLVAPTYPLLPSLDFTNTVPCFLWPQQLDGKLSLLEFNASVLRAVSSRMETQEQSKTDAVTHMVQEAKLQTDFLQSFSFVRHTVRNHAAEGSSLKEWWEPERYIGCGGFGSVQLQRCYDVDVLWDDSEYEEEGDDGGAKIKVGTLRAVKQISKPRDQVKLSGQFLHELHSLVFFATPKVWSLSVSSFALETSSQVRIENQPLKSVNSTRSALSRPMVGTRTSKRCTLRLSTWRLETYNPI